MNPEKELAQIEVIAQRARGRLLLVEDGGGAEILALIAQDLEDIEGLASGREAHEHAIARLRGGAADQFDGSEHEPRSLAP